MLVEKKEIPSQDLAVESRSSIVSDESFILTVKKEIPSTSPIPENPTFLLFDEDDQLSESPSKDVGEHNAISSPYNRPFETNSEKLSFAVEGVGLQWHEDNLGESSLVTEVLCDLVLPEGCSRGPEKESNQLVGWNSSFSIDKEEEVYLAAEPLEEIENQGLFRKDFEQTEKSLLLVGELSDETQRQQTDIENPTPEALYDVESPSLQGKEENSTGKPKSNSLVDFISACSDGIPSASERTDETEDQKVFRKEHEQMNVSVEYSPCMTESVNSSLPAWEVVPEIADDKENQTPRSLFVEEGLPQADRIGHSIIRSGKRPCFQSIWSRRGKAASVTPLQTGRSRLEVMLGGSDSENEQHNQDSTEDKSVPKEILSCLNGEEEVFTTDKESFIPNTLLQKSLKKKGKPASVMQLRKSKSRLETMPAGVDYQDEHHNKENTIDTSISKEIFSCLNDGEEEEIFTPDKENFTPNTLQLKSLKKKGKIEEMKHSIPSPFKIASSNNMHPVSSTKGNQKLKVLQELKFVQQPPTSENQVTVEQELMANRRRLERVPFQSLVVNSVGNSRSHTLCPSAATRSGSSVNCTRTVDKKVTNQLSVS